jgi:RHS repeat-associated protein
MQMPGRKLSGGYRYGFNGQEKSNEIAEGLFSAEYWEYDTKTGRRWNVDPVIKSWQSDYATFSNNPIWKIDPNGADDYFNSNGQLINRTKAGTKIYVQTEKGNVLLTQLNLNNASNRQTVANVIGFYATQVGIVFQPKGSEQNKGKGIVGLGVNPEKLSKDNPGFTRNKDILINKNGGSISSELSDYNNLLNVLIHEKGHKTNVESGVEQNLITHLDVYFNAINHKSFEKATESFQSGTVASYSNYLLNYYVDFTNGSTKQLEKYVDDFNKNNKAGYSIFPDLTSGSDESDYKMKIYKNNKKVGSITYKKIKGEGSDE